MKYFLLSGFFFLLLSANAQPARSSYNHYIIQAGLARYENKTVLADSFYTLAFAQGVRGLKHDFTAAAEAAAITRQWKRCWGWIDSAVLRGLTLAQLKELPLAASLRQQKGWTSFGQRYKKLHRRYQQSLNKQLQQQLARMLELDQQYRDGSWEKFNKNQLAVVNIDSLNFEALKKIVQQHGWPGFSLIGDAGEQKREMNDALFIIMHFPVAQKQFFLPYIMEAAARGECYPVNAAHLADRICMDDGFRPQVYGSLTFTGKDRVKRIYPVNTSDITEIDKRRHELGLLPLQTTAAIEQAAFQPGYSIGQFKTDAGIPQ
jgi:hypothetical protein